MRSSTPVPKSRLHNNLLLRQYDDDDNDDNDDEEDDKDHYSCNSVNFQMRTSKFCMEVYLDLNLVIFGPRSFKFFVIVDIEVTDKNFIKKKSFFFNFFLSFSNFFSKIFSTFFKNFFNFF